MFKKILIANRGEIACRIARTARDMGVLTVALYSDADAHALHVACADEAVHIGGAQPSESYLRGDVIIQAALDRGAEAIHPGYGFLSENPDFVEAVEAAGLTFIGPSSDAIRAMGLKDAAKALGDACCKHEQGAAIDLGCFLFRAPPRQEFCFSNNGLNCHSSRPPAKQRPCYEVVARPQNKETWMVERNGQRVLLSVCVPRTA